MTSWIQKEICDLALSKQIILIQKHHQAAKKLPSLFNLLQTSQVERRSSMFNSKSRNKQLNPAEHYGNIPSKIKGEIGSYALIHWTKAAIDCFSKVYTKYSPKRTMVNGSKERWEKKDLHSIRKRGRRNLVDDERLKKAKDNIMGSRLASNFSKNDSCNWYRSY